MNQNSKRITEAEEKLIKNALSRRESLAQRFPLVFALIGTFGFVSTLYGFEKLIDRIELFVNNPWILLATGVLTLIATGAAMRKLN